jgi:hypothetical protein
MQTSNFTQFLATLANFGVVLFTTERVVTDKWTIRKEITERWCEHMSVIHGIKALVVVADPLNECKEMPGSCVCSSIPEMQTLPHATHLKWFAARAIVKRGFGAFYSDTDTVHYNNPITRLPVYNDMMILSDHLVPLRHEGDDFGSKWPIYAHDTPYASKISPPLLSTSVWSMRPTPNVVHILQLMLDKLSKQLRRRPLREQQMFNELITSTPELWRHIEAYRPSDVCNVATCFAHLNITSWFNLRAIAQSPDLWHRAIRQIGFALHAQQAPSILHMGWLNGDGAKLKILALAGAQLCNS